MKTKNLLSGLVSCGLLAGVAQGADIRFMGNGDYLNPAGWQGGAIPGASDTARFNWGNNTVTLAGAAPTISRFQMGVDESGGLVVNSGGSLTATGESTIGNNGSVTGFLTINSGGTVDSTGSWMAVGGGPNTTGLLTINGGTLNVTGHLWTAGNASSTATIDINGGSLNVGNAFELGGTDFNPGGTATLTVRNGGLLSLAFLNATNAIQSGSLLNINDTGKVTINGDYVTTVNDYFAAGKIASDTGGIMATFDSGVTTVVGIPEPGTVGLLGFAGLAGLMRRRRRAN